MGNYTCKNLNEYTIEEVSKHNKIGDAWVAIDGYVYNLSNFHHKGGQPFISAVYGKEASQEFHQIAYHSSRHKKIIKDYMIGKLKK